MKSIHTWLLLAITVCVLLSPLSALPKAADDKNAVAAAATLQNNANGQDPDRDDDAKAKDSSKAADSAKQATSSKKDDTAVNLKKVTTVRLQNAKTKKVEKLPISDYIYGVVAGECPMSYADEALKAQIVAAHTYTLHCIGQNKDRDYDLSTDPQTSQNYVDKKAAFSRWGKNAAAYDKRLEKLISAVGTEVMTYKGAPILAVYHAISAGKTETSKNVWGHAYSYLQSVNSVGDKLSSGYLSTVKLSYEEVTEKLSSVSATAEQIATGKIDHSDAGNVLKITSGKNVFSGGAVAQALGLRSQNFDMAIKNKEITFTVRGYGHQCGMSQNGANFMANEGCDYKTILKHYYSGVTLENYS